MCIEKYWLANGDDSHLHVFSDRPLSFDVVSDGMNPSLNGNLSNCVSRDGITFWAEREPRINSIISVALDDNMLANCSEVEHDTLRIGNSVVGKVASIERNDLTSEVVVKVHFLKRNGAYIPHREHLLAV
ncbi:MAG: hypothetical protein HY587_03515 [Candidatus Omnitrophica bacterium]|nr:hypothetical protein [Candidatus Omnitrophota bacterium]